MSRRSPRLVDSEYYDADGNHRISYSDTRRRSSDMRHHSYPLEARNAVKVIHVSEPAVQPRTWFSWVWVIVQLLVVGLVVSWVTMKLVASEGDVRQLQEEVRYLRHLKDDVINLRQQLEHHKAMLIAPLANFALEAQGAQVITALTSKTHHQKNSPSWLEPLGPNTVIKGHNIPLIPGQCWPFTGQTGTLVIALPLKIHITQVTVGHILKKQSITGTIPSALKSFSVYGVKDDGLKDDRQTEERLGTFLYDADGDSFQTFEVLEQHKGETFRFVRLEIHDNYGNDAYTCVYSFRVHGEIPASSTKTSTKSETSRRSFFGGIASRLYKFIQALNYFFMPCTRCRLPTMSEATLIEPELPAGTDPSGTEI